MTEAAIKLLEILDLCVELEGSDVHITGDMRPYMRIQGNMTPVTEETLSPLFVEQMALGLMNDRQVTCLFVSDGGTPALPLGIVHVHDCLRAGVDEV